MRIGRWHIEFYNARKHRPVVYGLDWLGWHDREMRPFAAADTLSAIKMITDRMANVEYHAEVGGIPVEFAAVEQLFKLCDRDRLSILRRFFYDGYVDVDVSNPFEPVLLGECGEDERERLRDDRYVVTVLDDIYRTTGKTMAQILRPHLDMLDAVNDSDLNLIVNYGAMGVLSPESSTRTDGYLDDKGLEELHEEYRKRFGVRFGKWAMLITRQPVKFQRIDLPIKELELPEKRKSAMASVLQFLNIPKELHAMFDSAKYANRNEAELDMYTNCVSSWADKMLDICQRCYTRIRETDTEIHYPAGVEMYWDITGVAALQEAQWTEKQKAREELAMWRELLVAMPEKADTINKRISDLIDSL